MMIQSEAPLNDFEYQASNSGKGNYWTIENLQSIPNADGNEDKSLAQNFPIPPPDQVDTYTYPVIEYLRGDANSDKKTTVSDVVFLINYLFKGGPPPDPVYLGDVNCDGKVNVTDIIYLINYLFKGGDPPCS